MDAMVSNNADFRRDQSRRLEETITDLNDKINGVKASLSIQHDDIVKLRASTELNLENNNKIDRLICRL